EHGGGRPVSERRRGLGRGLRALIPAAPTERTVPPPAVGGGASSPSAGTAPVLPHERGVAAAKVATLPPVSRETEDLAAADGLTPPVGAHFAEIPLDSITPNPRQPRTVFDDDALAELVTSIKEVG